MNKAAHAYFQTKIGTTDQGQLLLMLYDGALKYIQQARTKMIAKDFAGKGIMISKVIDIVNELAASLNMDRGGSLAVNLNNLYLLCTARLLRANLKMDMESLDSVESILSGLRGAYAQIIETPEARKAAADIANRMQPIGSVTKTAQPITQHQGMPVPRAQAQAAYGRSAMPFQPQATAQPGIPGYFRPRCPRQRQRPRCPQQRPQWFQQRPRWLRPRRLLFSPEPPRERMCSLLNKP